MGNNSTRESRQGSASIEYGQASQSHGQSSRDHGSSRTRSRSNRTELGTLLGISGPSGSGSNGSGERRETRQEREARRLERERQTRLVERERSMREEHVDGGYLVTLGTYVGSEDFNKQIVRQLQIDRRLAPFWRGLNDFSNTWTEYQIAAAARGLDVPAADEPPSDDFFSRPGTALSSSPSRSNFGSNLAVPHGGHPTAASSTHLASSPPTDIAAGAIPVGSLAGTSSPAAATASPAAFAVPGANTSRGSGSQFKPRAKALAAALSVGSRNSSSTDISAREVQLPHDPFVNGQPIEVFLYKNAEECPICFLTYPPYLNHTRCCHQEICSECFVQIKRADPHYPEGHGDNGESPNPDLHPEEQAGQLISEPASCPYCQQPEFGVTYDPPPFRRGLVHSSSTLGHGIGSMGAAMSSNSSINSSAQAGLGSGPSSPPAGSLSPGARRRAQSLSANAPNVITTDRVRPDWATKLATQRAHIARRAAAATALHTAAFLMGSQEGGRSLRMGRFRRGNSNIEVVATGSRADGAPSRGQQTLGVLDETMDPGERTTSVGQGSAAAQEGAPPAAGAPRHSNMDDLEELMFREALRQSLATEEERRRQQEKKERKEAKRREKNEAKGDRKSLGGLMKRLGSGSSGASSSNLYSGGSSASASSLSVNAGNRRRGNSNASNLRVEASVASAIAVSGSAASAVGSVAAINPTPSAAGGAATSTTTTPAALAAPAAGTSTASEQQSDSGKGKGVDRGPEAEGLAGSSARPITAPSQPSAGPSHLRQMSSASSVSSSVPESAPSGSHNYANMQEHLQDPRGSGLSLGSRSAASDDADNDNGDSHDHDHDQDHDHDHGDHADDPSTSTDPLFNFGSLAAAVGVQIEGPHAGRRLSAIQREQQNMETGQMHDTDKEDVEHAEHAEHATDAPVPTVTSSTPSVDTKQTPEVMITPGTPARTEQFE